LQRRQGEVAAEQPQQPVIPSLPKEVRENLDEDLANYIDGQSSTIAELRQELSQIKGHLQSSAQTAAQRENAERVDRFDQFVSGLGADQLGNGALRKGNLTKQQQDARAQIFDDALDLMKLAQARGRTLSEDEAWKRAAVAAGIAPAAPK